MHCSTLSSITRIDNWIDAVKFRQYTRIHVHTHTPCASVFKLSNIFIQFNFKLLILIEINKMKCVKSVKATALKKTLNWKHNWNRIKRNCYFLRYLPPRPSPHPIPPPSCTARELIIWNVFPIVIIVVCMLHIYQFTIPNCFNKLKLITPPTFLPPPAYAMLMYLEIEAKFFWLQTNAKEMFTGYSDYTGRA